MTSVSRAFLCVEYGAPILLVAMLSWLVYGQNRYLRGDWYRFDSFGCADHSPVFYVDKVASGQNTLVLRL